MAGVGWGCNGRAQKIFADGSPEYFTLSRTHAVEAGGTGPPDRFFPWHIDQPVQRPGSTIHCDHFNRIADHQLHYPVSEV